MNHPNNIQPDPEVIEEEWKPTPPFQDTIQPHSEQETAEMRERYSKAEKALAEHGIEFKINTFQEYELATWQLMKIESDEQ